MIEPEKEYQSIQEMYDQVIILRNKVEVCVQKLRTNLTANQWAEKGTLDALKASINHLDTLQDTLYEKLEQNQIPVKNTVNDTKLCIDDWHQDAIKKYLEKEVIAVLQAVAEIFCLEENPDVCQKLAKIQKEALSIQKDLKHYEAHKERLHDFKSFVTWVNQKDPLGLEDSKVCLTKFGFPLTFAVMNHLLKMKHAPVSTVEDSIPAIETGSTKQAEQAKAIEKSAAPLSVPACEMYDGLLSVESTTIKSKMLVNFGKFQSEFLKHVGPGNYCKMAQQILEKVIDRMSMEATPPKTYFDNEAGLNDYMGALENLYTMGVIQKTSFKGVNGFRLNPALYPIARTDSFKRFTGYKLPANVSPTLRQGGSCDLWFARGLLKEYLVGSLSDIFPRPTLMTRTKEEMTSCIVRFKATAPTQEKYEAKVIIPLFDKTHVEDDMAIIEKALTEDINHPDNYFVLISSEEEEVFWKEKLKEYPVKSLHFYYLGKGFKDPKEKESFYKIEPTDAKLVISKENDKYILEKQQLLFPEESES